jgi:hypothetical protein
MPEYAIALYPEYGNEKEDIIYLETAKEFKNSEIFLCLFSEESLKKSKKVINYALKNDFKITADIHLEDFKNYNATYNNLSFFNDLGINTIRLNKGLNGYEEACMTYNEHGIKIEVNISSDSSTVEKIICYSPKKNMLKASHNYYPKDYTGLSEKIYTETNKQTKKYNIPISDFIFSQNGTFSVKKNCFKTPTLEKHRNMNIITQAKHLLSLELNDKIIIGNCYATKNEIKKLSNLNDSITTFDIIVLDNITQKEKEYLNFPYYTCRGDLSEYTIRTIQAKKEINNICSPNNTIDIKKGYIFIDNNNSEYTGELSIALKDIPNNGKMNVIGKIINEEIFLLNYLKSWKKFNFNII